MELVAVAGQDCRGASAETAGGMFRGASRPITLSFGTPVVEAWSCTLDELPLKQVRDTFRIMTMAIMTTAIMTILRDAKALREQDQRFQ